jgi:hypothetical protein
MRLAVKLFAALFLASLIPGCQKLVGFNYSRDFDLETGQVRVVEIDAPKHDQLVKVKTSCPEPISAYLVLDEDNNKKMVQDALLNYKSPDKSWILDGKEKTSDISLEGKVQANKAYAVLIAGATKKTTVKLTVEGN